MAYQFISPAAVAGYACSQLEIWLLIVAPPSESHSMTPRKYFPNGIAAFYRSGDSLRVQNLVVGEQNLSVR